MKARIEFDVDQPNVALSFLESHCFIEWSEGSIQAGGAEEAASVDPESGVTGYDLLQFTRGSDGPRAYLVPARRVCQDGRLRDLDTNERADFSFIAFRHGRVVPEVIFLPSEDWYPE